MEKEHGPTDFIFRVYINHSTTVLSFLMLNFHHLIALWFFFFSHNHEWKSIRRNIYMSKQAAFDVDGSCPPPPQVHLILIGRETLGDLLVFSWYHTCRVYTKISPQQWIALKAGTCTFKTSFLIIIHAYNSRRKTKKL